MATSSSLYEPSAPVFAAFYVILSARNEIEEITEKLKDAELSKKDRAELEERLRELNSLLSQFDRDGS